MAIEEAKEQVLKAAKDWAHGFYEPRSIREHQTYADALVSKVEDLEELQRALPPPDVKAEPL